MSNLVLKRRPKEQIVIGHDITITVVEISGNIVTLAIDAPRSTTVHRLEVYEQIYGQLPEADDQ